MKPLDELKPLLDATGIPWRAEKGTKHIKIFLREKLVGIVPPKAGRDTNKSRGFMNVRAQIKRAARELA